MSKMIERVAMAIRRNKFERNGRASVFDPSNISEEELGEARAAIEAMREPTGEMKDAGADTLKFNPLTVTAEVDLTGFPSTTWQAMIDAALSEKP